MWCGSDRDCAHVLNLTAYDYKRMRNITVSAAYSMANELNAPLPKNVTCVKPSGTLSKIMGTEEWGEVPEGVHMPLGKVHFQQYHLFEARSFGRTI